MVREAAGGLAGLLCWLGWSLWLLHGCFKKKTPAVQLLRAQAAKAKRSKAKAGKAKTKASPKPSAANGGRAGPEKEAKTCRTQAVETAFDFAAIPAPPPSLRRPPPPPSPAKPAGDNYLDLGVLDRLGDDLKEQLEKPESLSKEEKKPKSHRDEKEPKVPTKPDAEKQEEKEKEKSKSQEPGAPDKDKEESRGEQSESLEPVNKETQWAEDKDKAPRSFKLPPSDVAADASVTRDKSSQSQTS